MSHARVSTKIVKFCAEEVQRQHAEPMAVYWMMSAWLNAIIEKLKVSPQTIERLGTIVEPFKNQNGFRQCGVRVGGSICPEFTQVPRLIVELCEADLTPDEFYKEFQLIHPFVDGNGRTGKILYNILKHTLNEPQMPPNFFNCSNP